MFDFQTNIDGDLIRLIQRNSKTEKKTFKMRQTSEKEPPGKANEIEIHIVPKIVVLKPLQSQSQKQRHLADKTKKRTTSCLS